MRFLLDTNVLSEAGKARPNSKVLNWLLEHEASSGVPSIAIAERYQGAYASEPARREKLITELDAIVEAVPTRVIPFDAAAAKAWAEYVERPALKKRPRGYPDTQIAGIALARGLTIVTRNTSDFPELDLVNPWED